MTWTTFQRNITQLVASSFGRQNLVNLDLLDLCGLTVLAICASDLLGTGSLFARLVLNGADCLLNCTNNLVLERWLSLVMSSWGALLGDACSFGLLGAGCGTGLAHRLSGDGWENAWLGVAGCAACLGHCALELYDRDWCRKGRAGS